MFKEEFWGPKQHPRPRHHAHRANPYALTIHGVHHTNHPNICFAQQLFRGRMTRSTRHRRHCTQQIVLTHPANG